MTLEEVQEVIRKCRIRYSLGGPLHVCILSGEECSDLADIIYVARIRVHTRTRWKGEHFWYKSDIWYLD